MSNEEKVLKLYRATRALFSFLKGGMTNFEVYVLCKAELLYTQMTADPPSLETIIQPLRFTVGGIEQRNSLFRAFFELNEFNEKTEERQLMIEDMVRQISDFETIKNAIGYCDSV